MIEARGDLCRSRCASRRFHPSSLSDAIDAAEREGPALVVAIDGPGGAGKSTLARELALLRDNLAVVEGDDFYRPLPERTREALTPLEAVDLLVRLGAAAGRGAGAAPARGRCALPPLRLARRAAWREARRGAQRQGVVVIDGVYAARPALRGYLDLIVVVDAPRELCLARQLARGENDPAEIERWRAAEEWYLERQDPRHVADIVIDGS